MDMDHGAAIVTGAAGGIGSVVASRLAAQGMAVVLADIDGDRLEHTLEALTREVPDGVFVAVQGDVGDPAHHDALVEAALGQPGGLRLSVLNAGVTVPGISWEMPLQAWELTTRVNYWGVVHGLRAALRSMVPEDRGWVVAVSSGAGLVATPGVAPYVATKHAVVGLMESTHHELARIGSQVGVSVLCPGNIATDMPTRQQPGLDRGGAAAAGTGEADTDQAGTDHAGTAHAEVVAAIDSAIREGVASGAEPSTVADAIIEGVTAGDFWLLPQPEVAWAATDRIRRIAEGEPPVDLLG